MIDFTSALYLGMRHPSRALAPWARLTTGVPAVLGMPPGAEAVAAALAALMGCPRAVLAPSTLHLAWDVLGLLARDPVRLYLDAGAYPVLRWGAERAAAHGAPVHPFRHHDAGALRRLLRRDAGDPRRPVVVSDGWCPRCGEAAPLAAYLAAARRHRGRLLIDDTQALGILGRRPTPAAPYGQGGGGTLCWLGLEGADVAVLASMAKGFGVPVAVLAGSRSFVQSFEEFGETRVHSSPPSAAVIHAAAHALACNAARGAALRARLFRRVQQFRRLLAALGLGARGGVFPMQVLAAPRGLHAPRLYASLREAGIRAVLLRDRAGSGAALAFVLTARHTEADLQRTARALRRHFGPPGSTHLLAS
ncbi:MAG: aminotransferase class I/II-fold pyridoxal phosphate-dependent enzyme [Rhodothermales bacterium]|nr:aminotransferase class I/II-fold pyridoxal phosphate-dependent enzyme [Rhodothermales bacterium]